MKKERRAYLLRCVKLLFSMDIREITIVYNFASALK